MKKQSMIIAIIVLVVLLIIALIVFSNYSSNITAQREAGDESEEAGGVDSLDTDEDVLNEIDYAVDVLE